MIVNRALIGIAALACLAAAPQLAAAPITLFQLVPNNDSLSPTAANVVNSPAAADQAKNVTATTRTGGSFSAPFSGSLLIQSGGSNDGDRLTYSAGTGFFRADQVARFNNTNNAGVLLWDFDADDIEEYRQVKLFLDLALSGTSASNISAATAYVSINDADAGLMLDADLSPTSTQSGSAIQSLLMDSTRYTQVSTTTSTSFIANGIDLDPFIAASDDGLLRVAVGVTGFRVDVTVRAAGSRIDGVLVPEPSTLGICIAASLFSLATPPRR